MLTSNRSNPKNLTYESILAYALEIFQYDKDKVMSWWMGKQPELGDKSPYEMARDGKARQLIRMMERCV